MDPITVFNNAIEEARLIAERAKEFGADEEEVKNWEQTAEQFEFYRDQHEFLSQYIVRVETHARRADTPEERQAKETLAEWLTELRDRRVSQCDQLLRALAATRSGCGGCGGGCGCGEESCG